VLRAVRDRLIPERREPRREEVAGVRGCLFGLALAAVFWLLLVAVVVMLVRR
jgi:hypothetical protein